MVRFPLIPALASLVLLVTLAAAPAAAQYGPGCYGPPAVSYYAPPAPQPFVGASYSFYSAPAYAPAPAYAAVQSYYRPFPILRPRLYTPGPTYYTPTYPYTTGYYSYYYTPGYFRY
jgi:hypothetical protein